jgi:diaminopimelate decarboxylase
MKALSNISVLKIFDREGLHFDCSSVYEIMRVMRAGINPEKIELVSQELTRDQLQILKKIAGNEKVKIIASSSK